MTRKADKMTHRGLPLCPFKFSDPEFNSRAVDGYRQVRAAGRILWQPKQRGYVVTGYRDNLNLFRDRRFVEIDRFQEWEAVARKTKRDHSAAINFSRYVPFVHEGKRHAQLRRALARGIAPFAGGHLSIEASVNDKIAAAREDGGFDLAKDFACHLLFDIICCLLGLDEDERRQLQPMATMSWLLGIVPSVSQRDTLEKQMRTGVAVLRSRAALSIARSETNLLTGFHNALPAEEPDKLTAAAYLAVVVLIMGNDPLGGCITQPTHHLLTTSENEDCPRLPQSRWAEISDDAIRFASPVDNIDRVAKEDADIAGVSIAKGEKVIGSLLCANHDPTEFGNCADDITARPEIDTGIPFGTGPHACVGARISRTVIKAAYAGLASLPRMRSAGAPIYGPGNIVRGTPISLPIKLT